MLERVLKLYKISLVVTTILIDITIITIKVQIRLCVCVVNKSYESGSVYVEKMSIFYGIWMGNQIFQNFYSKMTEQRENDQPTVN